MATTTLLQHPLHEDHPLEPRDFSKDSYPLNCDICNWKISADGYACEVGCEFCAHKVCAEAPPRIDAHPLHTDHPLTLTLIHPEQRFTYDGEEGFTIYTECAYRCYECSFILDIRSALSTLSADLGGTQDNTLEQINLPLHEHKLTSFSIRNDFIEDSNCVICKETVEGDGYMCLRQSCKFLIHKRCVQAMYYVDGTKAPQVYHSHPLETFLGEDTGSNRCGKCGSDESREFIGCTSCQVFCCRDCVQVPESIQYPHHMLHDTYHDLVLLINCPDNYKSRCHSCLVSLKGKFYFGCPSCDFSVDMGCALQVLAYCEEGMSAEIKFSWHEHPLLLCHRNEYDLLYKSLYCSCCEEKFDGPMYACKEEGCKILLHKRCTELESTINHPNHPNHPLTLRDIFDLQDCEACGKSIYYLKFCCELCVFYLHAKCATHVPTRKHSLHEHELLHLERDWHFNCNRCGFWHGKSCFRCVPCNFNLHEECMELPQKVVNSMVHWHPLTLHETYIEDDSGEYYCDHCEKRRDERLGAYVCLQCPQRWAYHIVCVLPELQKVYEKKSQTFIIRRFNQRIETKEEEVREAELKLENVKRQLNEMKKKRDELIASEEKGYEIN